MMVGVTVLLASSGESGIGIFIALAVALIGIAFAVSAFQKALARKRTDAMKIATQEIGFTFEGEEWVDSKRVPLLETALFGRGCKPEFKNIADGMRDGLRVSLFDYSMTVGRGKGAHNEAQTVGAFSKDGVYLPYFELRRSGTLDQVWDALTHKNILFEANPEFARQYVLRSPSENDARTLFTPGLLAFFEQINPQSKWTVEGAGNTLIIYHRMMKAAPAELRLFLDETASVASSFFSLANCPLEKDNQ